MKSILTDIGEGIRAHRVRTAMICGAVALGAFALTVLLSVTNGLEQHTIALVRQLGEHTFVVLGSDANPSGPGLRLQPGMARILRMDLSDLDVSVVRSETAQIPGEHDPVDVVATDDRLASTRGWRIVVGRFLDESDVSQMQRNLVITESMSKAWNLRPGQELMLGRTPFIIVGIIQTPRSSLEAEVLARGIAIPDLSVFVPYTVEPDWIANSFLRPTGVDAIYVQDRREEALSNLSADVSNLLAQAGINTGQIQWVTPASLSRGLNKLKNMVAVSAVGVAVLSLVLGGITLASLMLANVRDRMVEIGLRRAFGAKTRDIVRLFVVEAIVITSASSLLGILSAAAMLMLSGPLPMPASLNGVAVIAPLLFGVLLGAFSAWWPARLAAGIQPSLALRSI